jgi:hypothetical protein
LSRTRRRTVNYYYKANGELYPLGDKNVQRGWHCESKVEESQGDQKAWYKAPKKFKKTKRQEERSRAKNALRNEKDIPIVKKSDGWDWN